MPARVAVFIQANKDAILHSWEKLVTSEGREVALAGVALRDDIPAVLDQLATWLASDVVPETSQLGARTLDHAMQRLDEGLPLGQLLREYRLLRETIIRFALEAEEEEQERSGAREEARSSRIEGLARLNAGLDVVLSQSVEQFVTERDRRAEAERAHAERFRALASASSEVLYRMSPDWSEMRQIGSQGVLANTDRSNANWRDEYVHTDDQPQVAAAIREAIRTKSVFQFEHRVRRADGSLGWTLSRAVPVTDDKGDIVEWFGSALDITERKLAEEELRRSEATLAAFFDASPGILNIVDEQLRYVKTDSTTPTYYGLTQKSIVGKSIEELAPEFGAQFKNMMREVIGSGETKSDQEVFSPVPGRGGEVVTWRASYFPVPLDTERRGLGVIGVEITDLKKAEAAREELLETLREQDCRKNDFLAVLSHELRNPLTPIRNSLYILERAALGGDQARRAQGVIGRQVDQLARQVEDLLDVTRLTRSKIQLQCDRLQLNELVQRAIEDHRSTIEKAGLTLETDLAAEPVFVSGDWSRLAQVVGNLLQNSAKFTPSGGRLIVSLSVDDVERRAVLRVADTGVGMTPDLLEGLFQPFSQAKQSLDRSKGGLGLGLALVKGLVELHGGEMEAHSAGVGHGSEFTVVLPLDVQEVSAGEAVLSEVQRPGRRVLVIEDNIDAADSLREVLELKGHEVAVAYDGFDGIAKAREFHPDVVLCDIGLPGMDGYAVARVLCSEEGLKDARLVALSGYALPEDLQRAAEAGFERHVAKPPSLEKLADVLADESGP